jgi:catechol 2,3-dioxygenase-like lactoylglutathione lyase family enzyme
MKIHHLAIQVREMERVLPFYRDILGMRETRQQAHAVWLDAGGVILMLERCPTEPTRAQPKSEPSTRPETLHSEPATPPEQPTSEPETAVEPRYQRKEATPEPWTSERPGFHLLAFATTASERESLRTRIVAAGHAIEHETGFTFYTRDPEGNRIGFSHYPEPRG